MSGNGNGNGAEAGARPLAPPAWFCVFVLTVISILHTNNFFAYHAPGAIAESLEQQYHITPQQLGILFQVYSLPNVILVFVGGLMIDRWGANATSIATNTSMLLGMILFAVAPVDSPMIYFTIGRLLLGIGGETLCAAAQTMISKWFRGSYLTFGMGFAQAFVQLFGSASVFYLLPRVASTRLDMALWITAAVCGVSLLANLVYVFMVEPAFPQYLAKSLNQSEWSPAKQIQGYGSINQDEILDDEIAAVTSNGVVDPISIAVSAVSLEVDEMMDDEPFTMCGYLRSIGRSVTSLPTLFWLCAAIQMWLSPILYTFTAFGPLYFQEKWHMSSVDAGSVTSVLYITIFFAPMFGFVIDRVGYRAIWQMCFSALIPVCFGLMHFTTLSPYYAMATLGLLFSITEANGFAMIAVSVPESVLGSAFGLCACGISFALVFEPYVVGWIKTSTGSFLISTWLFIGLSIFGFLFAVLTVIYDLTHDHVMTAASVHTYMSTDEEEYLYDQSTGQGDEQESDTDDGDQDGGDDGDGDGDEQQHPHQHHPTDLAPKPQGDSAGLEMSPSRSPHAIIIDALGPNHVEEMCGDSCDIKSWKR